MQTGRVQKEPSIEASCRLSPREKASLRETLVAGKNVDRGFRTVGVGTGIPLWRSWCLASSRRVAIRGILRLQRIVNGDGQEYEHPDYHEHNDDLYFSKAFGFVVFQFVMVNLNKLI